MRGPRLFNSNHNAGSYQNGGVDTKPNGYDIKCFYLKLTIFKLIYPTYRTG